MAETMEKVSRKAILEAKQKLGIPTKKEDKKKDTTGDAKSEGKDSEATNDDEIDDVPFELKVKFTEQVRRLNNYGLSRLVKQVKILCSDALEDIDTEKLHIKVDKIDKKSFHSLKELVDDQLELSAKTNMDNEPPKKRQKVQA